MTELQQNLIPETHRNHYLFSDYYLNEILLDMPEWQQAEGIENSFSEISRLYNKIKKTIENANESQTEERFIKPVLEILGHFLEVQTSAPQIDYAKRPDYTFFTDEKTKEKAFQEIGEKGYFNYAMAIGDAKAWNRPLDKKLKTKRGDPFSNANPNYQMDYYLRITNKQWGILTNGIKWRIYNRETSYLLDHYYEVDLVALLEQKKLNDFKYFYLFFRKAAFQSGGFLDTTYTQSCEYAVGLEEDLKERAYLALLNLAKGFWEYGTNKFAESDLKNIHDNCLIVLYQLLFILNAECRGLLPLSNPSYEKNYSLKSIRDEIVDKKNSNLEFSSATDQYWSKLRNLFNLIFQGNQQLEIAFFDGGLFDLKSHEFLAKFCIGDNHLSQAIEYLCFAETKKGLSPIDYRDLGIRHLGGIYEGILEYKVKLAKEDLIIINDKDKEVFSSLSEAKKTGKKINLDKIVKKGELYLATDNGERKTSGSYFTPEYIVNYIVEKTLQPLTQDKNPKEILNINVLDPAMGSGHFLLGATDFLAKAIHEKEASGAFLSDEEVEDEINEIRRHIVERCINGVDSNLLAVELAKLTLWLHTMAKGKPLSFLDHNLKCGNSLVGAKLTDLERLPSLKKKTKKSEPSLKLPSIDDFFKSYKQDLTTILGWLSEIEYNTTDSIEDIKIKKKAFKYYEESTNKYREIADFWLSAYFGCVLDAGIYKDAVDFILKGKSQLSAKTIKEFLCKAETVKGKYRFFHWELEFPEVFFDKFGRRKDNPGFDAVIGNPPYDVISEKEQAKQVDNEKFYYEKQERFQTALGGKLNYYRLFISLAIDLLKKTGANSFIVPMALLGDKQSKTTRESILTNLQLITIDAFPQKDDPENRVFKEAKLSTCLYILSKNNPNNFTIRTHPGKEILDVSPTIVLNLEKITEFDPDNLSIPAYPGMSETDFELALKLIRNCKGNRFDNNAQIQQGEVNLSTHKKFLTNEPTENLVLRGAHIDRYEFHRQPKQGEDIFLRSDLFLRSFGKDAKVHNYSKTRIGFQRGSGIDNWRRIIATIIDPNNFCSDTINFIVDPKEVSLFFVLAVLNSAVLEWRFRLSSTNNHVNAYEIESLPLPHIDFKLPKKERESLVDEIKSIYYSSEYNSLSDRIGNITKSDELHDIMAYFSEQIVSLNKAKQIEISGFLEWFERELGVEIDHLSNKSLLKRFYELDFDKILGIIKKNKDKLKVDPSQREFQEMIKAEYQKSIDKLRPLIQKIALTDNMIDEIVYGLYGLNKSDISIIKSVVGK